MLLPISLRPTTTPRSICSLLRAVTQDIQVIKPRFIFRYDHNRPLKNSIPNNMRKTLP